MIYNMRGDAYHAGPVMLSDVYTSAVGSAKDGVAASQRALYDAYNSLNSSKASITQSNTILNVPLFHSGTSGSALQTFDGNKTAYRAQLWASGEFGIYKTIDGGTSWAATKIITDPIGFSTDVYQTGNLTISTSTAPWSISATKSGYTVLMCSPLIYGYSAEVIMAPEGISFGNGSFSMSGFMRRYSGDPLTINIKVIVLWRKN